MISKDSFDKIIRDNLISSVGEDKFGYRIEKIYENYYNVDAFEEFTKEMQSDKYKQHYQKYINGAGSELKVKAFPPKMASVASSSRFCYLALRDGAEMLGGYGTVEFEHECKISGISSGTAPQLDAYIRDNEIYVEAKCHEIFDSHKPEFKKKYSGLIYGEDNDFGFDAMSVTGETFTIPLSCFGIDKKSTMFDIKQFICHLLGIASRDDKSKEAKLIYMFFKPKSEDESVQKNIDEVFNELTKEIKAIFGSEPIKNFICKNKISLGAIAEYSKVMDGLSSENMIDLVRER